MNEEEMQLAQMLAFMETKPMAPKSQAAKLKEKVKGFRRTRSLNAPSPIQQFGPCGRIMRNSAMIMTIQDPASQRLTWYKPPLSVLVIKKVRDAMVIPPFIELVSWLTLEKRMVVFVEASVLEEPLVTKHAKFPDVKDKLMSFNEKHDDLTDKIDFIICLGGDGTLLYASSLFQQSVPPVMAFHLGSLGFLTPFKFSNFQEQVTNVLEGHAALTLRSRLRCIIVRGGYDKPQPKKPKPDATTAPWLPDPGVKLPSNLLVLNEVVIDRGPSPYLSNLDLYLDGRRITSVQGDGLLVSTPTGSTAYAVAAGASMIHPSVPAIMVTPICPHSLSFRPIIVPAGVELKITVSKDSRNTAWISFDGRMRQELTHDDSLRVTTSIYPVPSICAEDQIADWFASLDDCLRWNDRKRQRHFDDGNTAADDANLMSDDANPPSADAKNPSDDANHQCDGANRLSDDGNLMSDDGNMSESSSASSSVPTTPTSAASGVCALYDAEAGPSGLCRVAEITESEGGDSDDDSCNDNHEAGPS
ncbi:NAD kinase-like isoform X3 [Hyalella azteca]|uniref:NAD(+) kinase n=1 Tax=Hyalella azteca TaxID=294128 RepID=A0A8B7P9G8_HYAAZ|nr:NAD kinase-like isoform X3 [Hyalella azteca]